MVNKLTKLLVAFMAVAMSLSVNAATRKYHPGHYVQMYKSDGTTQMMAAIKPGIVGMVRYYSWREMENSTYVNGVLVPSYDFSKIQADLNFLSGQGMRLMVVVGDKTFNGTMPTPTYLQGPAYTALNRNGGYTAIRWHPFVVTRYKAMLAALGKKFDSQPYFEGWGTAESALSLESPVLKANGYTPEKYRDALIDVLTSAAQSMPTSRVFWYMNFLAGGQKYLGNIATAVAPYGIIMGGPDIDPDNASLKKLTYPLYDTFNGKMKLFGGIETSCYNLLHESGTWPTKYWSPSQLYIYGRDNLHVNYIMWTKVTVANPADSYKWTDAIPVIGANPLINY